MDNETQPNIPPFQSPPQTPITPSTNWSKILFFIIFGLIIVAGAVFFGIKIGKKQIEKQQPITEQLTISPTQTVVNPTTIPITSNPTTDGTENWKIYKKTEKYTSYTNDWYNYTFKELKGNGVAYEFQYPLSWTENSGVFTDSQKNKVAEIAPGVVSLSPGQKCFDNPHPTKNLEDNSELVDQKNINLSGMTGILKINKFSTIVIGGNGGRITGYSYMYCLMFNDNAFVMMFYDHSINSESQKLFDQILSTFKFTN